MKSPLLKRANFKDAYEQVVLRTQALKKKNEDYQRMSNEPFDRYMYQGIKDDKDLLDQ